ncbi:MAG: hypothetical protein M0P01_12595 [Treponema sp.]|nr:hypothetical protein [Treponema sp.]
MQEMSLTSFCRRASFPVTEQSALRSVKRNTGGLRTKCRSCFFVHPRRGAVSGIEYRAAYTEGSMII